LRDTRSAPNDRESLGRAEGAKTIEVLEDDVLVRLLTFPNVLITPHQAFLTREALRDIARVTVEHVRRLAAGQPFLEGTLLYCARARLTEA
jgi:phosphoglycerate dehydrogenase-like enzyme